jgi:hypothetical protein
MRVVSLLCVSPDIVFWTENLRDFPIYIQKNA